MTKQIKDSDFDRVYELLDAAFPKAEKRMYSDQKTLLNNPNYRLILRRQKESGQIEAFLSVWEFDSFRYVEHFAVDASLRGQGIGRIMLEEYLLEEENGRPVILEVEPPETEIARRRIGFYQRIGFCLNEYPYIQPPYQTGVSPIPLLIMSSPGNISPQTFHTVKETLYREVYHAKPE